MTRRLGLPIAALLFSIAATANAGGYRFGISDQAFYIPAIDLTMDPSRFPLDRVLFEPQMRFWLGDTLLATSASLFHLDLPALFLLLYVAGTLALFAAATALARSLGTTWWATGAFLAMLTLRHRISKTGANTLEGYMHPRMLAFAIGLAALACLVRRRLALAAGLVLVASVVHPTTAGWFGLAVGVGAASLYLPSRWLVTVVGSAGVLALVVLLVGPIASQLTLMDPAWESALDGKDYLFPSEWPAYAWVANLAYPTVLWLLYRHRRRLGLASDGERALVAGLLTLVAIFLVSVPLAAGRIAFVVELQVNRIFWLLDAVVAAYLAWWLVDRLPTRAGARLRLVIVALIVVVSAGRGYYVLAIEAGRPLFTWTLPDNDWTDAMSWLRGQPGRLHVLADPGHAWKHGSSVRVAALQDVVLEAGKDSAMAMYDRGVALRVVERSAALSAFDTLTTEQARALGERYQADVLVASSAQSFDLPVRYRNAQFTVFDLR